VLGCHCRPQRAEEAGHLWVQIAVASDVGNGRGRIAGAQASRKVALGEVLAQTKEHGPDVTKEGIVRGVKGGHRKGGSHTAAQSSKSTLRVAQVVRQGRMAGLVRRVVETKAPWGQAGVHTKTADLVVGNREEELCVDDWLRRLTWLDLGVPSHASHTRALVAPFPS